MSYEVFFQNPSGISEDFAERTDEEDDLLQNQNKSSVVVEDENDQVNIDELNKTGLMDVINLEEAVDKTTPSNTDKQLKKLANNVEDNKKENSSQISNLTKQIEGISSLLLGLNDYINQSSTVG